MLKGINSHFSSKQKLPLSTRTHLEQFQPVHAVTWTHCPAGTFKPKGMGLENARSCPHSSHLHGLWMKCSGSGIPGPPCNILQYQMSPFSMSRSILMPMFPANSPPPPPPLHHHLHNPSEYAEYVSIFSTTAIPSREETQTLGIFRNSETSWWWWGGVCTSEHPIQPMNLAPGKGHPAWHPQVSPESLWNPIPRPGWKTLQGGAASGLSLASRACSSLTLRG